jgi:hypothetical protein
MAKQPTKQHLHSWAVYHIEGTPAKLIGIVYDQPDADAAIKQAIKEYNVPPNERGRLIAQRAASASVFPPKALKDDATCIKDRAVQRGGVLFSNG